MSVLYIHFEMVNNDDVIYNNHAGYEITYYRNDAKDSKEYLKRRNRDVCPDLKSIHRIKAAFMGCIERRNTKHDVRQV